MATLIKVDHTPSPVEVRSQGAKIFLCLIHNRMFDGELANLI